MLYSCPLPIRSECFKLPNTKSASFDSWTNKRLNVLIRQPHTILYLEKKKRIYHNAINHVRALGFSRCHGQLQKALLIKFYSFCVDLCVKSLKIWSGAGACSFCTKRHLNSFTWPLKSMHKGLHLLPGDPPENSLTCNLHAKQKKTCYTLLGFAWIK